MKREKENKKKQKVKEKAIEGSSNRKQARVRIPIPIPNHPPKKAPTYSPISRELIKDDYGAESHSHHIRS